MRISLQQLSKGYCLSLHFDPLENYWARVPFCVLGFRIVHINLWIQFCEKCSGNLLCELAEKSSLSACGLCKRNSEMSPAKIRNAIGLAKPRQRLRENRELRSKSDWNWRKLRHRSANERKKKTNWPVFQRRKDRAWNDFEISKENMGNFVWDKDDRIETTRNFRTLRESPNNGRKVVRNEKERKP